MSTNVKLSIAEYDALIAQGYFDDAPRRVELLYGELREMSPANLPHDNVIQMLTRWSIENTAAPIRVGIQTGLGIPKLDSVPEPDVSWIRPGRYIRTRPGPADAQLVIEVADSSLTKDLLEKRDLYADGGVKEYWVVDVSNRQMHEFRRPSRASYQDTQVVSESESIAPLANPSAILDLGWLIREALD